MIHWIFARGYDFEVPRSRPSMLCNQWWWETWFSMCIHSDVVSSSKSWADVIDCSDLSLRDTPFADTPFVMYFLCLIKVPSEFNSPAAPQASGGGDKSPLVVLLPLNRRWPFLPYRLMLTESRTLLCEFRIFLSSVFYWLNFWFLISPLLCLLLLLTSPSSFVISFILRL